jgi:hypothetical protein
MYTKIDESGQPIGLPTNFPPEGDEGDWRQLIMPAPRSSEAQVLVWALVNGACVGSWIGSTDPDERQAQPNEIKEYHRQLEQSPIMVFGELFDCDERSELRMRDALATWDERPIDPGLFEEVNGTKVIYWTKADNSVAAIDKPTLQAVFSEMLKQRAIRGGKIYKKFRQLKQQGCTYKQLIDPATWA